MNSSSEEAQATSTKIFEKLVASRFFFELDETYACGEALSELLLTCKTIVERLHSPYILY
jgi:hypothetical protein